MESVLATSDTDVDCSAVLLVIQQLGGHLEDRFPGEDLIRTGVDSI